MKSSFNHDCMQHATPERGECKPLSASSAFCFLSSSVTSALYFIRNSIGSNDAAVSTSMEEMLHCAHAASDDSIFLKIKHFEHDPGL